MIRSIALTAFLTLIVCSCARGSQTQHQLTQASKPPTPSVIQQETPPPAQPDTATQQAEAQQAAAAQEKGDAEDDPRAARGDAGPERLAQMPADQQLPAGRWKAGENYDP